MHVDDQDVIMDVLREVGALSTISSEDGETRVVTTLSRGQLHLILDVIKEKHDKGIITPEQAAKISREMQAYLAALPPEPTQCND